MAGGAGTWPAGLGAIGVAASQPDGSSGTFQLPPASSAVPDGSGRTAPRIAIEPIGDTLMNAPGRGACTINPPPMYIPTCEASWK